MRWILACVACAALAGCSAVVSGDGTIRCDPMARPDPCPGGMRCQAVSGVATGVCGDQESCASDRDGDGFNRCDVDGRILDCDDANPQIFPGAPERCNGIDDNCNQNIDEEREDADSDSYTRCGSPSRAADCDEEDPLRNPGAMEVCDGVDNNCNGAVDEDPGGAGLCGSGAFCVAGRGCIALGCTAPGAPPCPVGSSCDATVSPATCVNDSCTAASCSSSQRCDRDTGACVDLGSPGDECVESSDCESEVCAPSASLGLDAGATGGVPERICVQACCSDANCPADEICWDGGRGARSCLPPTLIGTSVGSGNPTAACSSGSECRSGICAEGPGLCAATCGNDATCGSGLLCGPIGLMRPQRTQLTCTGSSAGTMESACARGEDCAVGICFPYADFDGSCSGACKTAADCPLLGTKCGNYDAARNGTGWTTVCRGKQTFGTGRQGAACGGEDDCLEERCVNGQCAEPCCTPEQCIGSGVCAPVQRSGHWEMRCVPAAG